MALPPARDKYGHRAMTANLPIIFVGGTLSLLYQILWPGYRPKSKTGSKAPHRDNVVINYFQLASNIVLLTWI